MAGCKHGCHQCTRTEPAPHDTKEKGGQMYHWIRPSCHPHAHEGGLNPGPPPARENQMSQTFGEPAISHS
jgi:hypothetical protein